MSDDYESALMLHQVECAYEQEFEQLLNESDRASYRLNKRNVAEFQMSVMTSMTATTHRELSSALAIISSGHTSRMLEEAMYWRRRRAKHLARYPVPAKIKVGP